MNLAALIGEVVTDVEAHGAGAVTFSVAVIGRGGGVGGTFVVEARGAQGEACRRFLRRGHRVAIEGAVNPEASPVQVVAERVQFLTSRAQAEEQRAGDRRAA